jgi:chromosome segregation ATPase
MESEKELGDHGSSALSTKITEPDGHHDIAAKTDALTTSRRYHDLIKELAGDDLPEQEEYFQLSHAFAWIATLSDRLKEAQSERDTARREAKTNFTNRMLAQRTLGIQSTPVAIAEVDETSASLKLQLLVANARCEDLASTNQDRTRYLEGCLDQANGKTDVIRQFLATTQNQCDDLQKALDIAQLELSAMTAERDAMAAKVASLESRVFEAESRVESTTSRELSGPDLGWPIDDAQHIAKALAALDRIKQLTSRVHDSNEPQNSASISLQAS